MKKFKILQEYLVDPLNPCDQDYWDKKRAAFKALIKKNKPQNEYKPLPLSKLIVPFQIKIEKKDCEADYLDVHPQQKDYLFSPRKHIQFKRFIPKFVTRDTGTQLGEDDDAFKSEEQLNLEALKRDYKRNTDLLIA